MGRVLPFLLYLGLVTYALSDAMQRPERDPYGLPKWLWAAIIVLLPYVGALAWIVLSRTRPDPAPEQRGRPVAPDDDPEYLAWLREQARRRKGTGEGR
ncbi:PLD nuclease N-terminal domain-containing protein [Demequina soli]|uniref:PLD nuclease N-terminal domain-containing protein n=1 Tax=Demequina soli TaxID=1638987 RepID=UPI000782E5B7|nr:PLD nuclease N-terminal domain-containing protein [Demequina soli]